jgi:hypothetical protein
MRFVPSTPPIAAPTEAEQPRPLRAVRPVRKVEPREIVPLVFPRFSRKNEVEQPEAAPAEKRNGLDRRKWCRRTKRERYLLNTRSGEERRKKIRRRGEAAATLDEEV